MSPEKMTDGEIDIENGVAVENDASISASTSVRFATADVPPSTTRVSKGGKHLRWTRITKEVEVKETSKGLLKGSIGGGAGGAASPDEGSTQMKTILDGVSGHAAPGQVMALMGPSGSGKTSILDVLSGRSAYASGKIHLEDELVTDRVMKKLKKQIAYVKQSDLFFGHLTVRDQFTYTAMLRLPSNWPKSRKISEVDRIIQQLHLTKCADTPIFMVSGGEKKRVNIGTELLTDPSIILLDEPTSGLDSTSAVALMRILYSLAHDGGKTIITSIHQPSSAVFFAFDKIMLLADGNVVYFGTPQESLDHCAGLGLDCPSGYNAADHWMDLLVIDSANVATSDNGSDDEFVENDGTNKIQAAVAVPPPAAGGTKQKLIKAWDAECFATKIESEVPEQVMLDNSTNHVGMSMRSLHRRRSSTKVMQRQQSIIDTEKSFNTTWWMQYRVLMHRSMKNSRSAIFTPLNLIKAGAIGLMCGLLWFQMPYTESEVYDRSSYIFFTMTFWVFDAMFTAYMAFPMERSIIFKERASGAYHLSAYFLAKTTSEAPARIALPAIYMIISYWLTGINNDFGVFVGSTFCSLMSVLAGESIGLFLGAAILDMEQGMVIMTVVSLGLMVIGGFFVRNIPAWLQWLGYISPFKYSYNSSIQLVINKPVPCDGSGYLPACQGRGVDGHASVQEVLDFLGVEGTVMFNVGMLFVLFAVIRIMAFYALKHKKAEERM